LLLLWLFLSTLGADVSVSNTLGDGAVIAVSFLFGGENIVVNRTPANAAYLRHEKSGPFFKRAYFPQKLTPKSSINTEYKLFQKHVPSC
jgi:hypothetical protein